MCTEANKRNLYYHIAANHFSDCGLTLCPLEKFIDVTKDHIPDNWHAECFGTEKSTVSGTVFSCYIVYFHRFFNDYSKKNLLQMHLSFASFKIYLGDLNYALVLVGRDFINIFCKFQCLKHSH